MLSDRFYKLVGFIIPFASHFGVLKYTWCPVTLTFVPKSSKTRTKSKVIIFNQVCLLSWQLLLVFQLARFYWLSDYNQLVYIISCATCMTLSLVNNLVLIWWADDYMFLVNYATEFLRFMHGALILIYKVS